MRSLYPTIAITNESSVVSDGDLVAATKGLQAQVHEDFRPWWNEGANLHIFKDPSKVPPEAWHLAVLDDSDQAGALGYHDVTQDNTPLLKVFAKTDQQYNLSWTVTASHEILEALADPYVSACNQVTNTEFYALEVGDPVEADALGYEKHGILVSDFITPRWFVPGLAGGQYDYAQHLGSALDVAQGGYVSIFTSGQGWQQKKMQGGQLLPVSLEKDNPRFRDRSKVES